MRKKGAIYILAFIVGSFCIGTVKAPASGIWIEEGALSNVALNKWLDDLRVAKDKTISSSDDVPPVEKLLVSINKVVVDDTSISFFRAWDGRDEAVALVIDYLNNARRPTRKAAVILLVNVVDNTNVCYAIRAAHKSYLAYSQSNADLDNYGLYNALEVEKGVAGYAFMEVIQWISKGLDEMKDVKDPDINAQINVIRNRMSRSNQKSDKLDTADFRKKLENCVNVLKG